jgi:integrase
MSVYKRTSGRWAVLIDLDASATGKRRRRSVGTFATRKDAERAEREALTARDRGIDLSPSTITVAQLLSRFLRDRQALGRGAKTLEEYGRLAELYIVPHVGSTLVSKLRPAHVSEWVSTILEHGGRGGGPIAAKTARHALSLLSSALRWGLRLDLVGRNVCESVSAPSAVRSEAKALTSDEVGALTVTARGSRWEHFVTLALRLGARRGELLALHWSDVDLTKRVVIVRGSMSQIKGSTVLKSTKSGRIRALPLSAGAVDALRKQRVLQREDRLRAGAVYLADPADPVFTDEIGQRLSPKAATNAYARLAKRAGISTTRLHDLRHTAATNLIAGGIDVRTAASLLGHANASVTLSVYSHVVDGAERAAIDVLSERLDRAELEHAERA